MDHGPLGMIFDWPQLMERGAEAIVSFVVAYTCSLLFVIRLIFVLFARRAQRARAGLAPCGATMGRAFRSPLAVLGFFVGAGWTAVMCRAAWSLPGKTTVITSAAIGLVTMALAAVLSRRLGEGGNALPSSGDQTRGAAE